MIEKKLYYAEAKDMPLTGEYTEYPIFDVCKEENVTVIRSLLKASCSKENCPGNPRQLAEKIYWYMEKIR